MGEVVIVCVVHSPSPRRVSWCMLRPVGPLLSFPRQAFVTTPPHVCAVMPHAACRSTVVLRRAPAAPREEGAGHTRRRGSTGVHAPVAALAAVLLRNTSAGRGTFLRALSCEWSASAARHTRRECVTTAPPATPSDGVNRTYRHTQDGAESPHTTSVFVCHHF